MKGILWATRIRSPSLQNNDKSVEISLSVDEKGPKLRGGKKGLNA